MLNLIAVAIFAQTSISIGVGNKPDSVDKARREALADSLAAVRASRRDSVRRVRVVKDSARTTRKRERVLPVTPQVLATAFKDERARRLFLDARAARMRQDSSIQSYDATAYERMSVGLGFKRIGRERLLMRTERASHVTWNRNIGAQVEVKGMRTAFPLMVGVSGESNADLGSDGAIPYFPGKETLWIGSSMAKANIEDMELIHPLANGAEAYYTYEAGDSISFRMPGGRTIQLRELRIRAREPKWNLAVGSLWFDVSTAQLVRAVYRMAASIDIWAVAKEEAKLDGEEDPDDDVPRLVKPLIMPMKAQVTAMTVEYGLHEGKFWLPRAQGMEGDVQVSFMRVPFKMEQTFTYASVNGANVVVPAFVAADTAQDSASVMRRRTARKNECATNGNRIRTVSRSEGAISVRMVVPCDSIALTHSPDLPKSIYDENETVFGSADRDALIEEALGMTAQPGFIPQPPKIGYGLYLTRYNRVEGLSSGIDVTQTLGAGYSGRGLFRIGTADLSPNVELSLARSDMRRTYSLGAYKRLEASNSWGSPFALGNSLSALLFGRDEGFYYRTTGVEFTGTKDSTSATWRLFAEHQWDAPVNTQFSVNGKNFAPNIFATKGNIVGGAAVKHISRGLDPRGLRVFGDINAEAAAGTFDYARGFFDVTFSHGLTRRVDGALTLGAGTSGGAVPPQRLWYLGGTQTVRGQRAGAAVGNSFWMTRAELGSSAVGFRPIVFGDIGWAGSRDAWKNPGRPLSGAGAGLSIMDGLLRFDVARGIYPETKIRTSFYLEARF
ncbi:MAG: hypothetical protein H0U64_12940 [Gemmatimonadaceae bacterium]|nr:hypothetical protein [Gemmatimonadaceae bacterium]